MTRRDRVHLFARAALPLATVMLWVAVLGAAASHAHWPYTLLAAGGAIAIVRAVLMVTNYEETLTYLAERRYAGRMIQLGVNPETRFGGAVLFLVSLGWIAI